MRRAVLSVFLFAGAIACGGKSNTAVTDQGNTLAPKSSAAAVGVIFGFVPFTEVIVADVPDVCGAIPSSACSSSAGSASVAQLSNATVLALAVISTAEGDYKVADPDADTDGGSNTTAAGTLQFMTVKNNQTVTNDVAVSGTIHLDKAEIGGGAEGHYDVVMKSGAHLQGDFTADNCPALSSLFSSLNDTSGCSSSSSNFGDGGT